jgi:16S rRNA pseudouridine516 synthase
MRLDKYLSEMGAGTRSELKKAVRAGRVTVNGVKVKDAAMHVEKDDVICMDGERVAYEQFVYYLMNKPAGVISATEDTRDRTVLDLLDGQQRKGLFPVGRLDRDTEGLLLITNDGPLAHALLSPSRHVEKEYFVRLRGPIGTQYADRLKAGIVISGGYRCMPADMKQLSDDTCTVILREGKFHEIKRMFEALGNQVEYLQRLRMKNLVLDESLEPGDYRPLSEEEIEDLRESLR